MNSKALNLLEFNKIKQSISELCVSELGAELARNLFPIKDIGAIEEMQKQTSEAEAIRKQKGPMPFFGLKNVKALSRKAELGSVLELSQLIVIRQQLSAARKCKAFINSFEDRDQTPVFKEKAQLLELNKSLEEKLENCVLSDTELSDNASVVLKQIRKKIQQKNEGIRSKLNGFVQSSKNQKYLQDAIITIRQGRFVVPVKLEYKAMVPGMVHDQSSSGATLFIEPMAIVEMNNELKELKMKEEVEIERILMELTEEIAAVADILRHNQDILQQMDFMMAKGEMAVSMKAISPKLSKNRKINIINARHPLLDPKEVVPISVKLGEVHQALIITGPNTGGKTVTLKTVGLLTLMTQSGLHIPADYGSEMGIFDQIFADIGDEQSIEQSLSTFSSHMTNIVEILKKVTGDSLVLLDELGAGTDPTEGAALAMAILTFLRNKSSTVLATTHYSELKQYALMNEDTENASVEFDVETLSPTYRLLTGIPGKSNAFEISSKLGIEQQIIEDAKTFLTQDNIAFEDVLRSIEEDRILAEEESEKAVLLRRELEHKERVLEEKERKILEQKDQLISNARKEAYVLMKEAKQEADSLIEKIRKMRHHPHEVDQNKEAERIRKHIRGNLTRLEDADTQKFIIDEISTTEAAEALKVGDEVNIPSLNQQGIIVSLEQEKRSALVQVGVMKMTMPLKSLIKLKQEQPKVKKGLQKIIQHKTEHTAKECDVRGEDLEEALYVIDKYLDDSYLSGYNDITIIHGVGTGVLKQGIQKMLKKHRLVKHFREGVYGEGGTGVTIVTFKTT